MIDIMYQCENYATIGRRRVHVLLCIKRNI